MRKVLSVGKFILKVAFIGIVLAWMLIMDFVGLMVCAISEG